MKWWRLCLKVFSVCINIYISNERRKKEDTLSKHTVKDFFFTFLEKSGCLEAHIFIVDKKKIKNSYTNISGKDTDYKKKQQQQKNIWNVGKSYTQNIPSRI